MRFQDENLFLGPQQRKSSRVFVLLSGLNCGSMESPTPPDGLNSTAVINSSIFLWCGRINNYRSLFLYWEDEQYSDVNITKSVCILQISCSHIMFHLLFEAGLTLLVAVKM